MKPSAPFDLTAHLSLPTSLPNLGWVSHLVVTVRAEERDAETIPRSAIHLALVLDASASMDGAPMEQAKESACRFLKRLTQEDRFSLLSFSNDVKVHLAGVSMTPGGQEEALRVVASITTRARTNISQGWQKGFECLLEGRKAGGFMQDRILILSDGHANAGITTSDELLALADEQRSQGVMTTAVGLGAGYSIQQLEAVGQLFHASRPEEVAEIVLAELQELRGTVAEDICLHLALPAAVVCENLNFFPVTVQQGQNVVPSGSLLNGKERVIVCQLLWGKEVPPGEGGTMQLAASFRLPSEVERKSCENIILETRGRALTKEVDENISVLWRNHLLRHALRMGQTGRGDEAEIMLEKAGQDFAAYFDGCPFLQERLDELAVGRKKFVRHLSAMESREIEDDFSREMEQTEMRSIRSQGSSILERLRDRAGAIIGAGPITIPEVPAGAKYMLLLAIRNKKSYYFAMESIIGIGRHPANQICCGEENGVSRFHAQIVEENGQFLIRDIGSRNGTRYNGRKETQHVLRDGDTIILGDVFPFIFRTLPLAGG